VQISDMNDAQLASNRPNACSRRREGGADRPARVQQALARRLRRRPRTRGAGRAPRAAPSGCRRSTRSGRPAARWSGARRAPGGAARGWSRAAPARDERCVPHNPTLPSVPPCPPAVGRLFAASRTPTAAQRSALQHRQTAARHASARKCTGGRASASFLHCTPQRLQGQHGSDSAGATAADCSERARACRSPVPCQKCVAAASRGGSRDTLNAQCRPRKRAKSSNSGAPLRWRRLSGTIICGRGCEGSEPCFEGGTQTPLQRAGTHLHVAGAHLHRYLRRFQQYPITCRLLLRMQADRPRPRAKHLLLSPAARDDKDKGVVVSLGPPLGTRCPLPQARPCKAASCVGAPIAACTP